MSSRSLNKVTLIGNLTRDPELRYTPAGTAVCTFGLATNRAWTTQTGETREETEFHRIVSWNKLAELCAQLLAKGRKVYVEGRLATRTWNTQDGTQRTTVEIVIDDMIILDSKRLVREESAGGVVLVPSATAVREEPAKEPKTEAVVAAEAAKKAGGGDSSKGSSTDGKKKTKKEEKKEEKSEEKNEDITPDDIPF